MAAGGMAQWPGGNMLHRISLQEVLMWGQMVMLALCTVVGSIIILEGLKEWWEQGHRPGTK